MSTNYNVQLKDPENPDNFWFPITLKGNVTDLTIFDSTHYSTAGLVPASGGESNKFLRADGTWATVISNGGYGICSTAASTQVKEVSITGFSLANGVTVQVRFTEANTASSPKLNVSNTGSKDICISPSVNFNNISNRTYSFVYDSNGDVWYIVYPSTETWTFTTSAGVTTTKSVAVQ